MAAVKKVGQKNGEVGLLVEYLFCDSTLRLFHQSIPFFVVGDVNIAAAVLIPLFLILLIVIIVVVYIKRRTIQERLSHYKLVRRTA